MHIIVLANADCPGRHRRLHDRLRIRSGRRSLRLLPSKPRLLASRAIPGLLLASCDIPGLLQARGRKLLQGRLRRPLFLSFTNSPLSNHTTFSVGEPTAFTKGARALLEGKAWLGRFLHALRSASLSSIAGLPFATAWLTFAPFGLATSGATSSATSGATSSTHWLCVVRGCVLPSFALPTALSSVIEVFCRERRIFCCHTAWAFFFEVVGALASLAGSCTVPFTFSASFCGPLAGPLLCATIQRSTGVAAIAVPYGALTGAPRVHGVLDVMPFLRSFFGQNNVGRLAVELQMRGTLWPHRLQISIQQDIGSETHLQLTNLQNRVVPCLVEGADGLRFFVVQLPKIHHRLSLPNGNRFAKSLKDRHEGLPTPLEILALLRFSILRIALHSAHLSAWQFACTPAGRHTSAEVGSPGRLQ